MIKYLILLVLFGCASPPQARPVLRTKSLASQPDNPPMTWIHWTPAIDSDNTVYVLLATTNLKTWQTVTVTDDTNAYSPLKPMEFYRLYSSNTLTRQALASP